MRESGSMYARAASAAALAGSLLGASVLSSGCFSFRGGPLAGAPGGAGAAGALGSFTVTSALPGNATVAPTACVAGGRRFFLGGDFLDPASGLVARLVVDPLEGPVARVFAGSDPFRRGVTLRRADCAVFRASLEPTGLRIDQADDDRLSLEIDCTLLADGTSVRGSASTTHCH